MTGVRMISVSPTWEALPTLREIIASVAEEHGLTYLEIISHRRHRALAWPRQKAYWRCRKETTASLPQIGHMFDGRDHTTIMQGIKAYEKRLGEGVATGG